jgi:hypothetical protein
VEFVREIKFHFMIKAITKTTEREYLTLKPLEEQERKIKKM